MLVAEVAGTVAGMSEVVVSAGALGFYQAAGFGPHGVLLRKDLTATS